MGTEQNKKPLLSFQENLKTGKKFLKSSRREKANENSNENSLLSSMPEKLKIIHEFTKSYNVDRKINEERVGAKRIISEFEQSQQILQQRFNRFN